MKDNEGKTLKRATAAEFLAAKKGRHFLCETEDEAAAEAAALYASIVKLAEKDPTVGACLSGNTVTMRHGESSESGFVFRTPRMVSTGIVGADGEPILRREDQPIVILGQ